MASLLPEIPHEALQVAFFQLGSSTHFSRGWVHEKTVPYGIIAQATTGQYEITCAGKTVRLKPSEAFLTPAYTPLRIVHHHDTGKGFAARWLHFSFVLYQTIDVTSLLDLPLRLKPKACQQFGEIMSELAKPVSAKTGTVGQLTHMAQRRELI